MKGGNGRTFRADARMESRVTALERNDGTQDKQISELFSRVNALEKQGSAQDATQRGMQTDITEAKTAAQAASDKLDALKMWMLATMAGTLASTVILLVQWAAK